MGHLEGKRSQLSPRPQLTALAIPVAEKKLPGSSQVSRWAPKVEVVEWRSGGPDYLGRSGTTARSHKPPADSALPPSGHEPAMPAAAADALAVATPKRQRVWQAQPLTRRLQADPPPGGQSMPYSNVEARPKSWGRENWGG